MAGSSAAATSFQFWIDWPCQGVLWAGITRPNFEARDKERAIRFYLYSAPGAKCQFRDPAGESEPGLRLNRQRLQCDRAAKAADERVRAKPNPYGRRCVDAGILSRESPGLGSDGWGKNGPGQHAPIGFPDIESEFANCAVIMLSKSACRCKRAGHFLG